MLGLGVGFYGLSGQDQVGFQPSDIPNLSLHMEYTAARADGSQVTSIPESHTPVGADFKFLAPTTPAHAPTINQGNGSDLYPGVVVFSPSGTPDRLNLNDSSDNDLTEIVLDTSNGGYTIFFVGSGGPTILSGNSSGSSLVSNVGGGASTYSLKAGGVTKTFNVNSYSGQANNEIDGDDVCVIMLKVLPNGNTSLFIDNVAQVNNSLPNTNDFVFDTMGGVDYDGRFRYLFLYDRALEETEINQIFEHVAHVIEKA